MQLFFDGDAHLLGRLAQGSLVSMGVGGVEGVDMNEGTPVAGLRPGANIALVFSPTDAPRQYVYIKFSLPTDGKNRVLPV